MLDTAPPESPGRYGPHIAVMREMHWSWRDLNEAPVDLVEEILLHVNYQRMWERERADADTRKMKHGQQH